MLDDAAAADSQADRAGGRGDAIAAARRRIGDEYRDRPVAGAVPAIRNATALRFSAALMSRQGRREVRSDNVPRLQTATPGNDRTSEHSSR